MEVVPTSPAPLVGCLHICTNDGVTDGTLILSLQSALHIPTESDQSFDHAARAENDDLEGSEP